MAARLAVGIDPLERLHRLAVIFAVELRLMIMAELYIREMSAQQFCVECGGGTVSRISQNFTRLKKEGLLRYVRSEGPGGTRHGGVEHFYRATEPPYFDAETWALLPYSVRCAASLNLFRQIAPRLRLALEEGARTGSDLKHELSAATVVLDETGWQRVIKAFSVQFTHLYEEQEDARRRALNSGERLFRADVLLAVFPSLSGHAQPTPTDRLLTCSREPLGPFAERLAPILRDDVQRAIVSELNVEEHSVTKFHREIGGTSKSGVDRRFRNLTGGGWIARSQSLTGGRRRAATEHFYRATKPAVQTYDPCAHPSIPLRKARGWEAFEYLCETAKEAMLTGAFDSKNDRFLSWSMLRLDQQGWANVLTGIEALAVSIAKEEQKAKTRLAKSGETPTTLTLALAGLESSSELLKVL